MQNPTQPAGVRALLAAVLEAIAIPHPATVGDSEKHGEVLADRVMHARIALENVLERDDDPGWSADYLRGRLAEHPPTGYRAAGSPANEDRPMNRPAPCDDAQRDRFATAGKVTAPRTVAVPTLDQGDVTIPEPAWCAGHDDEAPQLLSDTGHLGAAHRAEFGGDELAFAALVQDPHAVHADRNVGVLVEMGHLAWALTPDEVDGLAAALVDYAGALRHLARQLSVLRAGGEGR